MTPRERVRLGFCLPRFKGMLQRNLNRKGRLVIRDVRKKYLNKRVESQMYKYQEIYVYFL